jgi:HlyD family secretion protein
MAERSVQTEEASQRTVRTPETFQATKPAAPSATRQGIAVLIGLLVIGGGAVFLHTKAEQKTATATVPVVAAKPQPVVTVTVARAESLPLVRTLEVTGSISAWDPLSIGSEASGLRIDQILVEEGDRVRKGQVLATLNSSVLQAQLQQAEARLQSAGIGISQKKAALAKSQATYREATANLKRYENLHKQGAISSQDLLARQTQAQATQSDLEQARLAIQTASGSSAEISAQVKQYRAQIAQTQILAPDDGMIARRDAHLGAIVSAGTVLFAMVRDNRLELRAEVPEVDLPKIRIGQRVIVSSDADTAMSVNGRVRIISPQVDDKTRLGMVRIDVPATNAMRPGMFVRGQVALGERKAIQVPAQAVLSQDDSAQVFVLTGEQVQARTVATGIRNSNKVEILSGLRPGEQVIVAGAGYLKDGDYVRLPKTH